MKITFYGQLTCLIEAAGMRIVTDPYLSHSVDDELGCRKYPPACTLAELSPDIVLISHPHRDHLDADTLRPYYRLRRRSFTLVPAPSVTAIEELGGEAVPMRAPAPAVFGEPFTVGEVSIRAVPCAHTELHRDGEGDFIELSYIIEAEGKKVFFGGDMSMYDGLLDVLSCEKPDVMILPVNGSDYFRTSRNLIGNLDTNEAAELAARVGTKVFIPGHFDLYDKNGCNEGWIRDSAEKFGAPLHLLHSGDSVTV